MYSICLNYICVVNIWILWFYVTIWNLWTDFLLFGLACSFAAAGHFHYNTGASVRAILSPVLNIRPERIVWFIENQALLSSYDTAPPPLSRRQDVSLSQSSYVWPVELAEGVGDEPIIRRRECWSSINHSILSDLGPLSTVQCTMYSTSFVQSLSIEILVFIEQSASFACITIPYKKNT
jgi:hypothetical protein